MDEYSQEDAPEEFGVRMVGDGPVGVAGWVSGWKRPRGTKGNRGEQLKRWRARNKVKYREYMRVYMANRKARLG